MTGCLTEDRASALQLHQHGPQAVTVNARDVDQQRIGSVRGHDGFDGCPERKEGALVTREVRQGVMHCYARQVTEPRADDLKLIEEWTELTTGVV